MCGKLLAAVAAAVTCLTVPFAKADDRYPAPAKEPIHSPRPAHKRLKVSVSESCLPVAVKRTLAALRTRFGTIKVISTFRNGATIRGTNRPSYHRWCRAADFKPPRGQYWTVYRWLAANHSGGVLYYPRLSHIHIDDGRAYRGRGR